MPADNAELVRRLVEASNDVDVERFVALCDPAVEIRPFIRQLEGGTLVGHDGVRRWFADRAQAFEQLRAEVTNISTHGDAVLIEVALHYTVRGAGVRGEQRMFGAAGFAHGKVTRWGFYPTRAEALTSIGLATRAEDASSA
jgi:ketosteroid isomerase-like protein